MQLCPNSASQCVHRGLHHNTCTAVCCQTSCKVQLSVNGKDASLSRHQDVKCPAQHPDQRPQATLPFYERQTAGRAAEGRKGKDGCSAQSRRKDLHLGQLRHADRSCRALRDDRMSVCERLRVRRLSCARSPAAWGVSPERLGERAGFAAGTQNRSKQS